MPGIVTITIPPATTQLTTLADVKDEIGITGSANDIRLNKLIDRASSAIVKHCGRVFGVQTVVETVRIPCGFALWWEIGDTAPPLIMAHHPVATLISVVVNGTALVQDTDFEIDMRAGLIYRLCGGNRVAWCSGLVVLAYQPGYTLPNDPAPVVPIATLPAAISDACLSLVRSAWFAQGRDPNVAMDMLDGDRTQFWDRSLSPMVIDEDMAANLADFVERAW